MRDDKVQELAEKLCREFDERVRAMKQKVEKIVREVREYDMLIVQLEGMGLSPQESEGLAVKSIAGDPLNPLVKSKRQKTKRRYPHLGDLPEKLALMAREGLTEEEENEVLRRFYKYAWGYFGEEYLRRLERFLREQKDEGK